MSSSQTHHLSENRRIIRIKTAEIHLHPRNNRIHSDTKTIGIKHFNSGTHISITTVSTQDIPHTNFTVEQPLNKKAGLLKWDSLRSSPHIWRPKPTSSD